MNAKARMAAEIAQRLATGREAPQHHQEWRVWANRVRFRDGRHWCWMFVAYTVAVLTTTEGFGKYGVQVRLHEAAESDVLWFRAYRTRRVAKARSLRLVEQIQSAAFRRRLIEAWEARR